MKLAALAAHLGATLDGDPDAEVTSAAGLEDAQPGQLTFLSNPRYTPLARATKATAILVKPTFEAISTATLRVANPYLAFARDLAPPPGTPAWYKIVQTGPTILEDHVEVQANSTIDRASVGETRIHAGVKIDNLVQVGHGSTVGRDTLLCAQVGLAGSSHVGKDVILAGQVGVAGHCTIGDGAIATAQSGIPGDVPAGATVSGTPAFDNATWLRASAIFRRLPDLIKELRKK